MSSSSEEISKQNKSEAPASNTETRTHSEASRTDANGGSGTGLILRLFLKSMTEDIRQIRQA